MNRTKFKDLKVGDKFKFINSLRKITYTLEKKIDSYVGEGNFPWIMLDTQVEIKEYIPCYKVKLTSKFGTWLHSFTEDYEVLKLKRIGG